MNIWILLLLFSTINSIAYSQLPQQQISQEEKTAQIQEIQQEIEAMLPEMQNLREQALNLLKQSLGKQPGPQESMEWQKLIETVKEVAQIVQQIEQAN